MNILIVLRLPDDLARPYYDAIRAAFPDLTINMVDHVSKAGPYLGAADVIITPHVAAMYDEYPARAAAIFNENLRRFIAGNVGGMLNPVAH